MKVYINGIGIEFDFLDTPENLLKKLSIKLKINPKFLVFASDTKNFKLEENVKLKITNLSEDLEKVESIESLLSEINETSLKYNLLKKDVILLFLTLHSELIDYLSDDQIKEFYTIDASLPDLITIKQQIEEFKKQQTIVQEQTKQDIKNFNKIVNSIKDLQDTNIDNFTNEEITFESFISLDTSIIEFFDNIQSSEKIPFISIKHKNKLYFKVYKNIVPSHDWIIEAKLSLFIQGIYFVVLNSQSKNIHDRYSSCYIDYSSSKIIINYKLGSVTKEEIVKTIEKSTNIVIPNLEETYIKGYTKTKLPNYNKAIFLDLVSNNDVYKYFVFVNERDGLALEKKRFSFFFSEGTDKLSSNSIVVNLSTRKETGNEVTIRISRIKSVLEIQSFTNIFKKLLTLYSDEYEKIVKKYSLIIPTFKKDIEQYGVVKERKDVRRIGTAAKLLMEKNPELFLKKDYVEQCQQQKQPHPIENVEEYIKQYGKNKILEFPKGSGDYYGCEPRDPTRKKDQPYLYIGVQNNYQSNKDKYDYSPCCFTKDQYTTKNSKLNKYLSGDSKEATSGTYILNSLKQLDDKRNGEVPFNIKEILVNLGYTDITKGKREHFAFLRRGVVRSKDSILYCLELAIDSDFEKMNREKRVGKTKKKLSTLPLEITKQETFGIDESSLRKELIDGFIDSKIFISLLEFYYKMNVFVIVVDETHSKGEFELPRYSRIYFRRDKNFDKTCVIFRYENQYELLVDYTTDSGLMNEKVYNSINSKWNKITNLYIL